MLYISIPSITRIDKETVQRMVFQKEKGSSSVRPVDCEQLKKIGALQNCVKDRMNELAADISRKEEEVKHTKYNFGYTTLQSEINELKEELNELQEKGCTACPYYYAGTSKLNLTKYGQDLSSHAKMKGLIGIYCLATSNANKDGEGEEFIPTPIHLSNLAALTNMDKNTARNVLYYWREQGVCYVHPLGLGKYSVMLTPTQDRKKYLSADKGGSGFISLTDTAVMQLLSYKTVGQFRAFLGLLYNMDSNLYRHNNIINEDLLSVTMDFNLLPYIRRAKSDYISDMLKSIIDTDARMDDPAVSQSIFYADSNPKIEASNRKNNDLFKIVRLTISRDILPKQQAKVNSMVPSTEEDWMENGLSADSIAVASNIRYAAFGDGSSLGDMFGVDSNARFVLPGLRERKKEQPYLKFSDTLGPAIRDITNHYGLTFLKEAIYDTLYRFKERIESLGDLIKSGRSKEDSETINSTIIEMSKYAKTIAKNRYNEALAERNMLLIS